MGVGVSWLTPTASAFESAVPEQFFGISAPSLYTMSFDGRAELRDRALGEIQEAGIDSVRTEAGWWDVEPTAPTAEGREYNWTKVDRHVEALARHGQTWMPVLHSPPPWAQIDAESASWCWRGGGIAPEAVGDFAEFAGALAERYGRGGSYWATAPADVPRLPIRTYEIWNEPNWIHFWCPRPQPGTFGEAVASAGNAIHAVDPEARLALGGLVMLKNEARFGNGVLRGMAIEAFLGAATAAVPNLADAIDAVAVHPYGPHPDLSVATLGWARRVLERVGLGDEELIVSEFGWNRQDFSEPDRAEMLSRAVNQLARTDCGVAAVYPHSWVSAEQDPDNREHWWGIASAQTGAPYASGLAYAEQVELFEGEAASPPPAGTVGVCRGGGEIAPKSRVHPPRVPDRFFGATVTRWPTSWNDRAQLEAMREANLGRARELFGWSAIEPAPEAHPGHELSLAGIDDQFTLLGLSGVSVVPAFHSAPAWAVNSGDVEGAYARFMRTFADRYRAGGAFWDESQHLDRNLAPRRFEIWSRANLGTSWWDGRPSAERYASMYLAAREALRGVEPGARAMASLSDTGGGGKAAPFIRAMVSARPELRGSLDAVYVQATSKRRFSGVETLVRNVRSALDQSGNRSAEIHLGFGAPRNGFGALTEAARARLYSEVADWAPRSDCGVEGLLAYSWSSAQATGSSWQWFGIADPLSGELSPAGAAYRDLAALFTGLAEQPAPRPTVHTCNRAKPDRDGDGFPDEVEDHPLDPALHP